MGLGCVTKPTGWDSMPYTSVKKRPSLFGSRIWMRIDYCGNGNCHGVGVQPLRSPDREDWEEDVSRNRDWRVGREGRVTDGH